MPAELATFRLVDRVFTRFGTGDDMGSNASSFLVEMRDMAHIVHSCTASSLVLIDELGRSTAVADGIGLCWAISEFLVQMHAYTLMATHYTPLRRLSAVYPNVKHLQVRDAARLGASRRDATRADTQLTLRAGALQS